MMKELNFLSIGFGFVLVGLMIIFFGSLFTALRNKEKAGSNVKVSFFGLIGPIPFGFSNDKKLFFFTIAISLIFLLLIMLFFNRVP